MSKEEKVPAVPAVPEVQQKQMVMISQQTAQEVINYLQTRPYAEVYVLIGRMLEDSRKTAENK